MGGFTRTGAHPVPPLPRCPSSGLGRPPMAQLNQACGTSSLYMRHPSHLCDDETTNNEQTESTRQEHTHEERLDLPVTRNVNYDFGKNSYLMMH